MSDPVNHPPHYTAHPSGVEAIEITEHLSFNVGNAVKYLWRCEHKGSRAGDVAKACWYIRREAKRLEEGGQWLPPPRRSTAAFRRVLDEESPTSLLGVMLRALMERGAPKPHRLCDLAWGIEMAAVATARDVERAS